MKISTFLVMIILATNLVPTAFSAPKLQLNLTNINASLLEGFGDILVDHAVVQIDPVNVKIDDLDYALSMKENFFIIEGNGQSIKLDLKSFRRVFEQQKFNAVNTSINIKQGEHIIVDSEFFDVSLKTVKLNLFGAHISCAPESGRDITQEILQLCLKKSKIELKKGIMTGNEDQVYQWASNFFGQEKIDHLPKFSRPELTNAHASIDKGDLLIRGDLKVLLTMKLSATGHIEYQAKEDIILLKVKTLDTQWVSLKPALLKLLKLAENDFFHLDGDVMIFNLDKMRLVSPK